MGAAKKIETIDSLAEIVSSLITKKSGNVFGQNQQSMVVSRLKKRLIDLGMTEADQYYRYLTANTESETSYLVSLLTTHHTFFFREFAHFEFLLANLSEIVAHVKKRGENKIKIFCAACSRGQEVYSLAMFFNTHLASYAGMDFEIVGTDIDPASVKYAQNGVYPFKEIISVPKNYLSNHWQRGTGEISEFVRVKSSLKHKCRFRTANLLELKQQFPIEKFDIIFCRNVFIYFDASTITNVCLSLKNYLNGNGYLITGLSESLKPLSLDLVTHAPSVYSFRLPEVKQQVPASVAPVAPAAKRAKLKVLIVDDSPSVSKLLSKMFADDNDFELAGTAMNGAEAHQFLQVNKVDVMTLDIHMPVMDGVSYLQKYYNNEHPKVVVVSSASREDARYAQKALEYGASDFVEKPALDNFSERADEIKMKLKTSFYTHANEKVSGVDKDFIKNFEIKNPKNKARIVFSNFADVKKTQGLISELKGEQPPLILFFEGNKNYIDIIKEEISKFTKMQVQIFDGENMLNINTIYIADFKSSYDKIQKQLAQKKVSIGVVGACSKAAAHQISDWAGVQLLLDDRKGLDHHLKDVATDIMPWTSFAHIGTEYLAKD